MRQPSLGLAARDLVALACADPSQFCEALYALAEGLAAAEGGPFARAARRCAGHVGACALEYARVADPIAADLAPPVPAQAELFGRAA